MKRLYWKLWWWHHDRAEHKLTQKVLDKQGYNASGKRDTICLHDTSGKAVAVLLPVEDYETLVINADTVAIARVAFNGLPVYDDPGYDHGHLESGGR